MRTTLLLLSLSLAAFAAAQDTAPSTASAQGNMQSATTVRGCLSGTAGNYTLTDDQSGGVYALSGNIDNLASEIGHQVEITGQPSAAATQDNSGSAASTATPGAAAQQMFQVNTVKDVADHCGSGSSSGSSPAPVNATAAAEDQAAPDATTDSSTTTTTSAADPNAASPQTSVPAATPSRASDNNTGTATAANPLPATASPLPLAGVIGFGSLVAGLYIRK